MENACSLLKKIKYINIKRSHKNLHTSNIFFSSFLSLQVINFISNYTLWIYTQKHISISESAAWGVSSSAGLRCTVSYDEGVQSLDLL